MRIIFFSKVFNNINFGVFKKTFFLASLSYFCFYFFKNYDQVFFKVDFAQNGYLLFLSFLFCILSNFFNALAWKNIVIWFGQNNLKSNVISFYLITNILKYVPGGFWHFFERFNFLKKISNPELAFYSTLIEPYFMLCASFFLASIGIFFSPFYIFLISPLIFLNRKLIYSVLISLESLKSKTISALKITKSLYKSKNRIQIISFFPTKAFLIEVLFILTKFIGFFYCYYLINISKNVSNDIFYLLVIFCLSWAIGLITPTAPGGVGVFEGCFLFLVGDKFPQNIILVSLIYFRIISTCSDLFLSIPFLLKKPLDRI